MKTRNYQGKLKIILLVILLGMLKAQLIVAQIAQTGEFIVKNLTTTDSISINNCPTFACNLENKKDYINTRPTTENRDSLIKFIIDSLKFSGDKSIFLERLNKQIDSIKNCIIHTQILEFNIKNSVKKELNVQLNSIFKLRIEFEEELKKVLDTLVNIQPVEFNLQVNNRKNAFINQFNESQARLKIMLNGLSEVEKQINASIQEEKNKNTGVSALPQIFDLIEQVKPSVTLLGSGQINNFGVHSLGIYIGDGQGDTLTFNTIIIPEFSKYGFYATGYFSLNNALKDKFHDKIWINYAIHAHDKRTFDKTNMVEFNFFRLQSRLGLEFFIFKDLFSFYYNFNWIKPLTNAEQYRVNFNIPGYNQVFNDFGVRMLLKTDKSPVGGLGLFADLNFILLNDSFERFNSANDFVKPMIKLGIQANFR